MNVKLLTIWREKNYGAELQAYATIKILKELGHQVEMINIRLSDCRKGNFNQKIFDLISVFTPGYRKFLRFWNKYIPTTKRYRTEQELHNNPPAADVYIVGSDQVWNPELTGRFSLLYFLSFGEGTIKRISFASSFGTTLWKYQELTSKVKSLLARFDCVTCRENSGVELLKSTFNISAENVMDPTLVLGDFSELVQNIKEKNTLLYYPLGTDEELESFSNKLSQELNLLPVNNAKRTYVFNKLEWDRVGIEEWIRNIAESQFVVTRSFHGLVFSILFHKRFAIVASKNGRNTRIMNLLSQLGLNKYYFENFNSLYESKIWETEIDYSIIDNKLNKLRTQSINALKRALKI